MPTRPRRSAGSRSRISLGLLARIVPPAVLAALAAGCSPVGAVNALVPKSGYSVERDIAYGEGKRHQLDLYIPEEGPRPAPVIVFFYGGGWKSGDRADYRFVGEAFARKGYLVVVPDYRLHPSVNFPAFIEDGAAAVAWVKANVAAKGGNADRIYLMGHSAGAYIAAMLNLDRRFLAAHGLEPHRDLRGAIGLAGPYDFLPITAKYAAIFGPEPGWPETQPITFVDGTAPPMLLLTGDGDNTVNPRNTHRLTARIREKGGEAEEKVYANLGHIFVLGVVAAPFRAAAPVRDDILAWLARH